MSGACAICGKSPAPFGLGLPGFLSDLPPGLRGILWHCGAPVCRETALARREARFGDGVPAAFPPGEKTDMAGQRDLFGGGDG